MNIGSVNSSSRPGIQPVQPQVETAEAQKGSRDKDSDADDGNEDDMADWINARLELKETTNDK